MIVMPQFPLGSVLFPTMVLPLHVFEPRYQALMRHLTADDVGTPTELTGDLGGTVLDDERILSAREFGVPLIERGFEVGGEDLRSGFGTVARIVHAETFTDGRWVVVTIGVRRFRVVEWLPDDPYPIARIEDWPDVPATIDLTGPVGTTTGLLNRCLATASEAGHDVGPLPEISTVVEDAVMQLATLAPVSQFDRQRFLAAPGPEQRLPLIDQALRDAQEMFEFELLEG